MADKVTVLEEYQRGQGGDDARFLVCPVCETYDFTIVVRFASGRPFVATLVCFSDQCAGNTQIDIVDGFLEGTAQE
jgi:hypothetical protein